MNVFLQGILQLPVGNDSEESVEEAIERLVTLLREHNIVLD